MRILSSLPVLLTLFLAQTMAAQEPAIAPSPQPAGPQKTAREYYVEDGGAHGGILESIEVPPTLKAPFTLLLETEWVRGLPDGGTITTVKGALREIPMAAYTRSAGFSCPKTAKCHRR